MHSIAYTHLFLSEFMMCGMHLACFRWSKRPHDWLTFTTYMQWCKSCLLLFHCMFDCRCNNWHNCMWPAPTKPDVRLRILICQIYCLDVENTEFMLFKIISPSRFVWSFTREDVIISGFTQSWKFNISLLKITCCLYKLKLITINYGNLQQLFGVWTGFSITF